MNDPLLSDGKRQWTVTCPVRYILSTHLFSLVTSGDAAMGFSGTHNSKQDKRRCQGNRKKEKIRNKKQTDVARTIFPT